ncbi:MAG: CDP-diacylglycerol--glycerol-3-phosphate 3-phosphatidyltransferase [Candidatus Riflebacteria bacterium]|nr:CDP-diacylglycerol--glycerol-3-phosphate 3-phosphatidyltransferase [Candidatus Riflebacteria bacterium]
MTLATKLTLFRVCAIPIFVISFTWNGEKLISDWGKVSATAIFIIAAITDYYDGMLARYYQEVTNFGKFIDPIADKLLVSTALIVLVEYRFISHIPAWCAAIIIAREFAVTGLRLIGIPKGMPIEASSFGKWKTTAQMVSIITTLVFISFKVIIETYNLTEFKGSFYPYYSNILTILLYISVVITVLSGYDYFKKNWHLLDE